MYNNGFSQVSEGNAGCLEGPIERGDEDDIYFFELLALLGVLTLLDSDWGEMRIDILRVIEDLTAELGHVEEVFELFVGLLVVVMMLSFIEVGARVSEAEDVWLPLHIQQVFNI